MGDGDGVEVAEEEDRDIGGGPEGEREADAVDQGMLPEAKGLGKRETGDEEEGEEE